MPGQENHLKFSSKVEIFQTKYIVSNAILIKAYQ